MLAILLILLLLILLISFKFKTKITGQINNDGEVNGVEIMVLLK